MHARSVYSHEYADKKKKRRFALIIKEIIVGVNPPHVPSLFMVNQQCNVLEILKLPIFPIQCSRIAKVTYL